MSAGPGSPPMKPLARQIALLLALAAIPAGASALVCWKRGQWDAFIDHSVPLSEIVAASQPVLWVDARSKVEYAVAHIPGALLLNEDDWDDLLPKVLETWQPGNVVVVYCSSQSCHTSEEVAQRLSKEVGLPGVQFLRGGWEARKGAHK